MGLPFFDICCALKSATVLVVGTVRNRIASGQKNKDIARQVLRQHIITDVRDIKIKLESLFQTALHCSATYFKEGLIFIEEVLQPQSQRTDSCRRVRKDLSNDATRCASTLQTREDEDTSSINNQRLKSAQDRFRKAREEATTAFNSTDLSMLYRIKAAELRIASTILEHFGDARIAVQLCESILRDLNSLESIGATFSKYFTEKDRFFYDDVRLKTLRSVLYTNFVVVEYFASHSEDPYYIENWPMIRLPEKQRTVNPLLVAKEVVKDIFGEEEFQLPKNQVDSSPAFNVFAINSTGQVIALDSSDKFVFAIQRNEETNPSGNVFCKLQNVTENSKQTVKTLAIDRNDNVFVVISSTTSSLLCRFVLLVFDKEGKKVKEHELKSHRDDGTLKCVVVVDNQDRVIVHFSSDDHVNVMHGPGKFRQIQLEKGEYKTQGMSLQCTTDKNEIVMFTKKESVFWNYADVVLVYANNGKLRHTIPVQKDLCVQQVIFNYETSKLEILASCITYGRKPCGILKYSADSSNEDVFDHVLLTTIDDVLCKAWLISHPNGPVAFVTRSSLRSTAVLMYINKRSSV